jgi:hypothetical protein
LLLDFEEDLAADLAADVGGVGADVVGGGGGDFGVAVADRLRTVGFMSDFRTLLVTVVEIVVRESGWVGMGGNASRSFARLLITLPSVNSTVYHPFTLAVTTPDRRDSSAFTARETLSPTENFGKIIRSAMQENLLPFECALPGQSGLERMKLDTGGEDLDPDNILLSRMAVPWFFDISKLTRNVLAARMWSTLNRNNETAELREMYIISGAIRIGQYWTITQSSLICAFVRIGLTESLEP